MTRCYHVFKVKLEQALLGPDGEIAIYFKRDGKLSAERIVRGLKGLEGRAVVVKVEEDR